MTGVDKVLEAVRELDEREYKEFYKRFIRAIQNTAKDWWGKDWEKHVQGMIVAKDPAKYMLENLPLDGPVGSDDEVDSLWKPVKGN